MNLKYMGVFALCVSAALVLFAVPAGAMTTQGVDIHGFASQGFIKSDEYNYLAHNSKSGSFEYNEFGINFSKDLTDRLHMGIQFFSRDIGDASNNKVTVDWAYGDYRFRDWLGLRAGRIKIPFGLYNETRDMDMLRTPIVLPQGIYDDLIRDFIVALNGVGLYGNKNIGAVGTLYYQVLAGAMTTDAEAGMGKVMNSTFLGAGELAGDIDNDTSYAGSLRWNTPIDGLMVGSSFYNTVGEIPFDFGAPDPITLTARTSFQIYYAEYTWNDLIVAAEYMHRRRKTDESVLGPESATNAESYYLSASYAFNGWFTLGAYYSVFYPDMDDKDGDDLAIDHNAWEKDLALTLRFDINAYMVFKIEGHAVDGTANVLAIDNIGNDYSDSEWYYWAAKLSFSF